ncbi:NAD(+) synthase [uncultured Desulfovibrio sp.]|uniref:NAD(+) synthase n=1 Tax=uncultured Desulfovibrio sp. TaxID=167968 RepID=UPI00280542E5|nr:NAD(+) synthase [uncultured Desulfovibrio sp.]
MNIAMIQCDSVPGDVAGNAARILEQTRRARGAALCVTPELALCGPRPGEYLHARDFARGCRAALDSLAAALADGPALLLGAPAPSLSRPGDFANAAILLHKGQAQVVSRKVRPHARRHAVPDAEALPWDDGVSCGTLSLEGWRFGVVVCEDAAVRAEAFWRQPAPGAHDPLGDLTRRGVDAIIHMTAAPYRPGAQEEAERVLSHVAAREHVHLLSVNLVGGDGGIVYSGQSLAFDPAGRMLARGAAFASDLVLVDTAADAREHAGTGVDGPPVNAIAPACSGMEESLWRALVLGTRDYVRKSGATRALLGLSGGMDSALVACVAAEALGPENVTGVLMPSPHSSRGSVEDAERLARNLGMKTLTVPIAGLMEAFAAALAPGLGQFPARPGDVTLENLQARIRGTILASLANRAGALVLNTGNKSEVAMGYCTLYGDAVGALAVIGDITKTGVYALGRWLNAAKGRELIPEAVFTKAPSAELRPGQKDTDSLPPYDRLDPLLERLLAASGGADAMRSDAACCDGEAQAEAAREAGMDDGDCAGLCAEVRGRLFAAEFKRRQLPPALRVSRVPFGQNGWQVPAAGRYRMP